MWLYRALHRAGFANQPSWEHRDDGLVLKECYITAACHCAPPGNKPLPGEIANCGGFLREELERLRQLRVVVTLGRIAFETYLKARGVSPLPEFGHNRVYEMNPVVVASYHPSRQNTNTGKLTEAMLDGVFATVRQVVLRGK
jgi:uracil-DNA glycosylase family 4